MFHLEKKTSVCKNRAATRKNHPTLDPQDADKVIDNFAQGLESPAKFEGFNELFVVNNNDDVKALLKDFNKKLGIEDTFKK